MAPVSRKEFLRLNQLLTQALSKQLQGSPDQVDLVLLQTKSALTDILKGLSVHTNVQLYLDIQGVICDMMSNGASTRKAEEFLRVNGRVSEALENQYKRGNVDHLIKVNMRLSHVILHGNSDNLISLLIELSEGISNWVENEGAIKPYFQLNDAISQTLALKFEEGKLDFLSEMNRFLAEIMSRDYPYGTFFRLIQLTHIVSLGIIDKCENLEHLNMAYLQLSELIRSTPDPVLLEDLLNLNSDLARIFMQQRTTKFCRLVGWKLQLSNVMHKVSAAMAHVEDVNGDDSEDEETSRANERTSHGGGMGILPTFRGALNKTKNQVDLGTNDGELPSTSAAALQEHHPTQPANTEELDEQRAEVPSGEERTTAEVVGEVQSKQPIVGDAKQNAAEKAASKITKVPGNYSRSKKDFMTRMHLPPVTSGQKKMDKKKSQRPRDPNSEDDANEQ